LGAGTLFLISELLLKKCCIISYLKYSLRMTVTG